MNLFFRIIRWTSISNCFKWKSPKLPFRAFKIELRFAYGRKFLIIVSRVPTYFKVGFRVADFCCLPLLSYNLSRLPMLLARTSLLFPSLPVERTPHVSSASPTPVPPNRKRQTRSPLGRESSPTRPKTTRHKKHG